jgi:hypothetical protein
VWLESLVEVFGVWAESSVDALRPLLVVPPLVPDPLPDASRPDPECDPECDPPDEEDVVVVDDVPDWLAPLDPVELPELFEPAEPLDPVELEPVEPLLEPPVPLEPFELLPLEPVELLPELVEPLEPFELFDPVEPLEPVELLPEPVEPLGAVRVFEDGALVVVVVVVVVAGLGGGVFLSLSSFLSSPAKANGVTSRQVTERARANVRVRFIAGPPWDGPFRAVGPRSLERASSNAEAMMIFPGGRSVKRRKDRGRREDHDGTGHETAIRGLASDRTRGRYWRPWVRLLQEDEMHAGTARSDHQPAS